MRDTLIGITVLGLAVVVFVYWYAVVKDVEEDSDEHEW